MTIILRHLATGTICPGGYCEECLLRWMTEGQAHFTVQRSGRPPASTLAPPQVMYPGTAG